MAIALVPGQFNSTTGTGLSQGINFPHPPGPGTLVVVGFSQSTTGTFTCSDGTNSYTPTPSTPTIRPSSSQSIGIFYLINVPPGAPIGVTVTSSISGTFGVWLAEFSGAALFTSDAVASGSSTTINLPSITTGSNDNLLFDVATTAGSISSVNSPWSRIGTNEAGDAGAYSLQPTAGPIAVNDTNSASVSWAAIAAAFTGPPPILWAQSML